MKYYIFADNFRGFRDTCIPISSVNFLVGENSTGKTSILSLLKLLSGSGLFLGRGFDSDYTNYNSFSDMVSVHAVDKSFFRVGFVWQRGDTKKKKPEITACLVTFEEERGHPKITRCTFFQGTKKISLLLTKDLYCREEDCEFRSPEDAIAALRTNWVAEHSDGKNAYKKVILPSGMARGMPILVALSFVMGGNPKRNEKRKEVAVFPPDFDFLPNLIWLAQIRTEAKSTYDQTSQDNFSPEGKHTPYLIRRMFSASSRANAAKFRDSLAKIGDASGLFQEVRIRNFGRGSSVPFELDIVLDGKALNITSVGYGVSQSLPVLTEILARPHGAWFSIQQPEVHLHPRAQAALGDLFFELAVKDHKFFLVETHSDFMIDRFRMNYAAEGSDKPESQILFFERKDKHNVVSVLSIDQKDGELPADQPDSYRRFFIREQMRLLGI